MTLKLEDLRLFHRDCFANADKISVDELDRKIAERFGCSVYTLKNIKNALIKFKFICLDPQEPAAIISKIYLERKEENKIAQILANHPKL